MFHGRRRARLEREITLLEGMDAKLWQKAMICAVAMIGLLSLIFFVTAAKLRWFGWSAPHVALGAFCLSALCWYFSRYTLWPSLALGALGISLIIAALTEGFFLDLSPGRDDFQASPVEKRRLKCLRALAKRKMQLELLENSS
jgi:hypothetical protein